MPTCDHELLKLEYHGHSRGHNSLEKEGRLKSIETVNWNVSNTKYLVVHWIRKCIGKSQGRPVLSHAGAPYKLAFRTVKLRDTLMMVVPQ